MYIMYLKEKERKKMKSLSGIRLFVTPYTLSYHTPLSTGFSRQEYSSRLPFPSPEDLPNPGIEPGSPTIWATREALCIWKQVLKQHKEL